MPCSTRGWGANIMPKVLNKHTDQYRLGDIYIGRGSKWGNPFTHLKHLGGSLILVDSRDEAIECYKNWFLSQPELIAAAKKELKNKNLLCFCKPLPCHGDFLLELANSD